MIAVGWYRAVEALVLAVLIAKTLVLYVQGVEVSVELTTIG